MDTSQKFEEDSTLASETDDLLEIHYAIIDDDAQKLDELCTQGVKNIDGKFMDDLDSQHLNMTPLALSAALNKEDLVKVLLKHGADVDATFANLKTTALMTSSFHGHASVVKLLLDHGANVKKTDVQKSTALGYCFGGSRSAQVVTLLLQAGIDVNISNVLGMNAFLLVSGYGNEYLLRMVLEAGANVKDAVNNFGHTPLHLSILGKQSQIDGITGKGRYSTAHFGLNRRNMKTILLDWANKNRSTLLNGCMLDKSFELTGQLLEDLGAKMSSLMRRADSDELWSEEEVMRHKIEIAAKYRKEKLNNTVINKKSGLLDSILSCGGKLGKHGKGDTPQTSNMFEAMPLSEPPPLLSMDKEEEVRAFCENFARSLRALLDAGCPIHESEYTFGLTVLDIAILNGDTESIAMLLCAGADHNHLMKMLAMTDLYRCFMIEKVDKKQIKDMLDFDPHLDLNMSFENSNIPTRLSESENDDMLGDVGLTPLSVIAKASDNSTFDIIKMLIKHGANPNHVGKGGRSSLGEACRWGNVRMVEYLISQGADVEQINPAFNDATPIAIAVLEKQPKTVEYLLSKGAYIDKMMSDGRTCIIMAADEGDMTMVEILLKAGIDSNFSDKAGFDYQIAEQYQSSQKDIRRLLDAISNKSNQLREEDVKRLEAEKKIQSEIKQAGNKARSSYEDFGRSNDIYEEIGTENIASKVVPKIRKKKKKTIDVNTSEDINTYEVINDPQARVSRVEQEPYQETEPIYSRIKKTKKSISNANGFIGNLAVETLETNDELIKDGVATGISKVSGQTKNQVESFVQTVVDAAAEFSQKKNKIHVEDSEDDQTALKSKKPEAKPRGTPIALNGKNENNADLSGLTRQEIEIHEAMKNVDLNKIHETTASVQIVPAKRKKKQAHEERPDEDTVDCSKQIEIREPISLEAIDSVIVKPKARRRRTKLSTEEDQPNTELAVEQQNKLIENVTEQAAEVIHSEMKVKKKKKTKVPVVEGD